MPISFDYVMDNIVHVYDRDVMTWEVKREILIDLESLKTIDFDHPLFPDELKKSKKVTIRFRNHSVWLDQERSYKRKCIKCNEGSDTTYCKQCWKEIG
jgi:hypothetical protein